MKKLFFVWVVMLYGFAVLAQDTDNLFGSYISIKNALVDGDHKAVSQATGTFQQSLKSGEQFVQKEELLKAVEKLSKASGIEKQRAAFNDVSVIMWALVKDSDKIDHAVYYQYCPMKKAYWLSREKEIKNPYYGSSMLTCGKVIETKK